MHDPFDVDLRVSALSQDVRQFLKISNCIDVMGGLLGPKFPIKIAADGSMPGISGQLTDVVNMISYILQVNYTVFGVTLSTKSG